MLSLVQRTEKIVKSPNIFKRINSNIITTIAGWKIVPYWMRYVTGLWRVVPIKGAIIKTYCGFRHDDTAYCGYKFKRIMYHSYAYDIHYDGMYIGALELRPGFFASIRIRSRILKELSMRERVMLAKKINRAFSMFVDNTIDLLEDDDRAECSRWYIRDTLRTQIDSDMDI